MVKFLEFSSILKCICYIREKHEKHTPLMPWGILDVLQFGNLQICNSVFKKNHCDHLHSNLNLGNIQNKSVKEVSILNGCEVTTRCLTQRMLEEVGILNFNEFWHTISTLISTLKVQQLFCLSLSYLTDIAGKVNLMSMCRCAAYLCFVVKTFFKGSAISKTFEPRYSMEM